MASKWPPYLVMVAHDPIIPADGVRRVRGFRVWHRPEEGPAVVVRYYGIRRKGGQPAALLDAMRLRDKLNDRAATLLKHIKETTQ